ncbi:MAG: hypothetical protein V4527_14960 [Pseudomonadota bacterium]
MKSATDENLGKLAEDVREGLRHIHNVAKAMFIMRDRHRGDERMEGALDLLANKLEGLVGEVGGTFEKIAQAITAEKRLPSTTS